MFFIYIIYSSKSDRYYIGLTSDVQKRISEHNDPSRINKYTSKHLPWDLRLYFEVSENRGEAQIIERFIKNQKSRPFLGKLIAEKHNPEYFSGMINNVLKKSSRRKSGG